MRLSFGYLPLALKRNRMQDHDDDVKRVGIGST
jgi:hypothetical protein